MTVSRQRRGRLSVALICLLAGWLVFSVSAWANHQPSNADVTITTTPELAASGSNVVFNIFALNDGPARSCPTSAGRLFR